MLCHLWGWPDDTLCGVRSSAFSGQQPDRGPEGRGLPEPQAWSCAGLQPLRLPSHVGRTRLGPGNGSQPSMELRLLRHFGDMTAVFILLQCSRSCGGGFQRRRVLCKQRLADGSVLELPDTFCPSKSPAKQQPCARQECPPQWVTTDWSQVGFP